jgi:hypothetical protein
MSRYESPTTINASEGLGELINYINVVTQNWFGNLLIVGIWVIVLMGYYKAQNDFKGALAVAGYVTFVVSLLFWVGGWISGATFGIVVAVAIIGTVAVLLDK